jgi:hypothetical protein
VDGASRFTRDEQVVGSIPTGGSAGQRLIRVSNRGLTRHFSYAP